MDFGHNDYPPPPPLDGGPGRGEPASGDPTPAPPPYAARRSGPRRFSGWRILWGVLFGLSVLANIGLFVMLIGLVAFLAAGQGRPYQEAVIREGPPGNKIVTVNVAGMIHGQQAESVYRQLKMARKDRNVKGIIVRVDSPGGTISGSDRIHKEIMRYRTEAGKPVVAFMQGVAASGGYYAAVACEKIVAEPTAITGSIGVIMSHFVFQDLLENKLGIQPVFLTEGEKKNWPSSFEAPKQEELDYLRERLLKPAYDRFVDVVKQGRQDALSPEDVDRLADGSIYVAPKALEEKLIDEVGYLDDAIDTVQSLAGISKAQVVEYRRPLSWVSLLNAKSAGAFKLDRHTLYELSTPEILYLWNAATR